MKCSLPSELQKCFRIMKTSIFLLSLCISVAASNSTFSQTSTISVSARNKTLKEVFNQIESSSEYIFVFNDQQVNLNKKIILNDDRYTYDNEEVSNLKNIISNIT